MEVEKRFIKKAFKKYTRDLMHAITNSMLDGEFNPRIPKGSHFAENARKDGNNWFMKKEHNAEIHKETYYYYTRSISAAPIDSEEMALGYGNRSAFLKHVGNYEDCMSDINKALKITENNSLRVKLLCRKVECMKELGLEGYENVLESAKIYFEKVIGKDREKLLKFINSAETCKFKLREKVNSKKEEKAKLMEMLAEKDLSKVHSNIKISHDKKYGRHVLANKDFEPGEIIFAEDAYVSCLKFQRLPNTCSYCHKTCLSNIPCDHCGLTMYCNQECKEKAWQKYHDIECEVFPHILLLKENFIAEYMICLRAVIIGVRDAGSIAKLREELTEVDSCSDIAYKGFIKEGKFDSEGFAAVYTLKSNGVSEEIMESYARKSLFVILCLLKNSDFFGKKDELPNMDEYIMRNKDVLFVACLFLRICMIKIVNGFAYPRFSTYMQEETKEQFISKEYYERTQCILPFASLLNHSCYPNAGICFTEQAKAIVYTFRPIKKNSQIFISYGCYFQRHPKKMRKNFITSEYFFSCKCQACEKNWPMIEVLNKSRWNKPKKLIEWKLFGDCQSILTAGAGYADFDKSSIETISRSILTATKYLKQPSELICMLFDGLSEVYSGIYEPRPDELLFTDECKDKKS